ncbi:MAG: hypothetical protein JXM69_14240 [Anaerolineae bacterium]|nr:hypothetical protein [Anaerolineae bacterium]
MPGPLPKAEHLRRKKKHYPSAALLPPEEAPIKRMPQLPKGVDWLPETRQWWETVWHSPMSQEFLRSDVPGLQMLAMLVDQFYREPKTSLAAEIRLQARQYGLDPLSRRRLEWSVARLEDARDKLDEKRSRSARIIDVDPRSVLDED